jgi:hypothetical protein
MIELSLIQTPNQEFNCLLDEQECTIQLRLIGDNFYFSLWLDDTAIVQNVICLPEVPILLNVPSEKFKGNFYLVDTTSPFENQSKANYKELGIRFILYYLTSSEIEDMIND